MTRDLIEDLEQHALEGRARYRTVLLHPRSKAKAALRWVSSPLTLPEAFYEARVDLGAPADVVLISGWPAMAALDIVRSRMPDARIFCDVDDDYPTRLAAWREAGVGYAPGQIGNALPGWSKALLSGPTGALLNRLDAAKGVSRRNAIAERAYGVAMTSPKEARAAQNDDRGKARYFALPPRIRKARDPSVSSDPARVIFMGTDKLVQNASSLAELDTYWRHARPVETLSVFGDVDAARWPHLQVVGYAQDKADVFSPDSVLLYPCMVPGGLKIKLIEAIEWGVPFLTTPQGVSGLPIPSDAPFIIGSVDEAMAALRDPARRRALRAAVAELQTIFDAEFSSERRRFWRALLENSPRSVTR